MIDNSDGDSAWLLSMVVDGWPGIILVSAAILFWIVAHSNSDSCSKRTCPHEMTPKLMEHQCLCTVEAK